MTAVTLSHARWAWEGTEDPTGNRVTVTWELRPVTFWGRMLLVRIRGRQLARTELPTSLAAAATAEHVRSEPSRDE